MTRSLIIEPLILNGSTPSGLPAVLEIKPIQEPGVWWQTTSGEMVLVSNAEIGTSKLLHFTTLTRDREVLNVTEHLLGLFFAVGLDRVCIIPHQARFPYESNAQTFWEKIKPALFTKGTSERYTPYEPLEVTLGPERFIRFLPDSRATTLECRVRVAYPGIGAYNLKVRLDAVDLNELTSSRPYGRSGVHRMLSRVFEREDDYVWFRKSDDNKLVQKKLREIAMHRLLDLLGALEHVRRPGGALVGTIITRPRIGHLADLELLRKIRMIGLERIG